MFARAENSLNPLHETIGASPNMLPGNELFREVSVKLLLSRASYCESEYEFRLRLLESRPTEIVIDEDSDGDSW